MLKATKYINVYTCRVTPAQWSDTNTNIHDIAKMNYHIVLRSSKPVSFTCEKSVGHRKPVSQTLTTRRDQTFLFSAWMRMELTWNQTRVQWKNPGWCYMQVSSSFLTNNRTSGRYHMYYWLWFFYTVERLLVIIGTPSKIQNSLSEWANLLFQTTELWASHIPSM